LVREHAAVTTKVRAVSERGRRGRVAIRHTPAVSRHEVCFDSGGVRCAAWLYLPAGTAPFPVVVMAHGFGGTRALGLPRFAERFVAAGLAVLVFDYRGFGDSEGEPRQLVDVARQQADWAAALAYVRGRGDLDRRRVALWGTSFAGGHVVDVAARDQQVAAVVAQVPMLDGVEVVRALGPVQAARLAAAGLRDELAARLGRPPVTVPVVGPPGALAAMTTPDAEAGYRRLVPPGSAFDDRVAARIALRLPAWRPVRRLRRVGCPLLVVVADRDAITPPGPADRAAEDAPLAEVKRYDGAHFDVYDGALFERVVADEQEFLVRHLRAG
jgi:dienelactone hydrolase